ncbi:unnamed protein product [Trichogramma brassicae]|uniref:Uncharacterized protein n=1 Tax=Trichogramma brassicae TaxID=86971 RepID=A0A6H5IWF8_9HYME|nr:unnamed protein product [Trichogramma brassicae]
MYRMNRLLLRAAPNIAGSSSSSNMYTNARIGAGAQHDHEAAAGTLLGVHSEAQSFDEQQQQQATTCLPVPAACAYTHDLAACVYITRISITELCWHTMLPLPPPRGSALRSRSRIIYSAQKRERERDKRWYKEESTCIIVYPCNGISSARHVSRIRSLYRNNNNDRNDHDNDNNIARGDERASTIDIE